MDADAMKFVSSLEDDLNIIDEDILGTMAHDYMLYTQGILDAGEITAILKALSDLRDLASSHQFQLNSAYEDIHPLIESLVTEKTGPEIGGKIHSGRSRNDQVAVDIRLKLRGFLLDLRGSVLSLIRSLVQKAEACKDLPFPLYTHLQPAQVGTLGHVFLAWTYELVRQSNRLRECFTRTNLSPLGACAVGGTSFPIDRRLTAELLGFSGIITNSLDAVSSRDVLVENASVIANIFLSMSRIAEDLVIFSSFEYKFIELPDRFCSVSSVLPQKKNADTLELIRGNAAQAVGMLMTEACLEKGAPSGYNSDFQECKMPLFRTYPKAILAARLLAKIIEEMEPNRQRIQESLAKSDLIALDLAEYIAMHHAIPFRSCHELLAKIVRYVHENGLNFADEWPPEHVRAVSDLAIAITGTDAPIDDGFFSIAHRMDSFNARGSEGSPSFDNFTKMKSELDASIGGLQGALNEDMETVNRKTGEFQAKIDELLSNS
jgi:argininosuccinate lyase